MLAYLTKKKALYTVIEHRTVFTAWDLAQTLHEDPKNIVKSLVVKLQGKDPVLVLLASSDNLDVKKFILVARNWLKHPRIDRSAYSVQSPTVSRIEFASEKWMREKLAGHVGATPVFANFLKLPMFYDKKLLRRPYLILNSGSYEVALKMRPEDFFVLETGTSGAIGAAKQLRMTKKK